MLKGAFRFLSSWKDLMHNPHRSEIDYLRMVKGNESHAFTNKMMVSVN